MIRCGGTRKLPVKVWARSDDSDEFLFDAVQECPGCVECFPVPWWTSADALALELHLMFGDLVLLDELMENQR